VKLFLATNSETIKTDNIKLLQCSVKSALQNTDLDVYVIFDGKKEELESKLPKEVNIIEHRHRCYDKFNECGLNMTIASGTFLRTEISYLCSILNIKDEYCLYTDYDVIFQKGDYSDLDNLKPEYFSACPEFNKNDWSYINAGVMLINIKSFHRDDQKILDFINNRLQEKKFKNGTFDQTILNYLYKDKIDKLPLEYNWKPYWGVNEGAKIIHFHGAKPNIVEPKWRYELNEIKTIRNKNIEGFNFYNNIFEIYK
jgi:lipopolysaccharide biosynthesis glycosyltransferase